MYPSVSDDAEVGSGIMEEAFGGFDDLLDLEPTPLADVIHQQHMWHHQHHHHHHEQHANNNRQRDQQLQPMGFMDQQFGRVCDAADFFDECGLFSSSSNHRHKRRRSHKQGVYFASDAMIHSNPRDIDEILTSWYSREELSVFKKERKDIVRALKRVNFDLSRFDTSAYCLRGLEAYSSISFNKMMQRKRENAIKSVLAEQTRQRGLATKDPSIIREICVRATEWARERALQLGVEDAKRLGLQVKVEAMAEEDGSTAWGHESNISQSSTTPSLCSSVASSSCYSSDGSPALSVGKSAAMMRFASPAATMGKSAAMAKYAGSPAPTATGDQNMMHIHPTAMTSGTRSVATSRVEPMLWSPQVSVAPTHLQSHMPVGGVGHAPPPLSSSGFDSPMAYRPNTAKR